MTHAVDECRALWEFRRRRHHIILRKSEKELTFEIDLKGRQGLTNSNGEKNTGFLGEGNSMKKHKGNSKYRFYVACYFQKA